MNKAPVLLVTLIVVCLFTCATAQWWNPVSDVKSAVHFVKKIEHRAVNFVKRGINDIKGAEKRIVNAAKRTGRFLEKAAKREGRFFMAVGRKAVNDARRTGRFIDNAARRTGRFIDNAARREERFIKNIGRKVVNAAKRTGHFINLETRKATGFIRNVERKVVLKAKAFERIMKRLPHQVRAGVVAVAHVVARKFVKFSTGFVHKYIERPFKAVDHGFNQFAHKVASITVDYARKCKTALVRVGRVIEKGAKDYVRLEAYELKKTWQGFKYIYKKTDMATWIQLIPGVSIAYDVANIIEHPLSPLAWAELGVDTALTFIPGGEEGEDAAKIAEEAVKIGTEDVAKDGAEEAAKTVEEDALKAAEKDVVKEGGEEAEKEAEKKGFDMLKEKCRDIAISAMFQVAGKEQRNNADRILQGICSVGLSQFVNYPTNSEKSDRGQTFRRYRALRKPKTPIQKHVYKVVYPHTMSTINSSKANHQKIVAYANALYELKVNRDLAVKMVRKANVEKHYKNLDSFIASLGKQKTLNRAQINTLKRRYIALTKAVNLNLAWKARLHQLMLSTSKLQHAATLSYSTTKEFIKSKHIDVIHGITKQLAKQVSMQCY